MGKQSGIDKAIADIDGKIADVKAAQERETVKFKTGLEVLQACRGVLVATKTATAGKPKASRKTTAVQPRAAQELAGV